MPAEDVYVGGYAKACQDYARKFYPDSWCILSAKYGFLFPGDIVPGSYDTKFGSGSPEEISRDVLYQQANKFRDKYDRVVIVAGSQYAKRATSVLPEFKVAYPLRAFGGIGKQLKAMKQARQSNKRLPEEWE